MSSDTLFILLFVHNILSISERIPWFRKLYIFIAFTSQHRIIMGLCPEQNVTTSSVKWTLVPALRLCTGRTAHRGSRGIAILFLDNGTRRGQRHASAAIYLREIPGTHCTGSWVGPRAGLDSCGKSRPTGIRSPDHPAHSQSLYRLRYPAHLFTNFYNPSLSPPRPILHNLCI